MLICPGCKTSLTKNSNTLGLFWVCPSCDGRAVSLELVRKAIPRPIVNSLWQRARSGQYSGTRKCPACRRTMAEVPIISREKTEYLDVCTGCHFIFFDPREYEHLPKLPVVKEPKDDLSPKAREVLALARLEILKKDQESEGMGESSPEHWWEIIPAIFGLPIEYNYTSLKNMPFVTWALVAFIAFVNIYFYRDLEEVITNWGLIPAELGRHFGFTFISSFFLHAGLIHLIGNLYFLLVFGDNTEDILGKKNFILLVAIATLAGHIAHIMGDPRATVPCVGASGGISGIMAYYCLRFPKASVGFLWYYRFWIRIPVGVMFALWVLSQMLQVFWQVSGFTNVSALAHLGGASIGILFWWLTKKSFSKAIATPTN
ncbi:MAG: rhomboid family intramembrane serine protease [Phycisphaerae bacterium]|nr:rhomboid family intramembrane serine protease [Phycisphaerae bacterium]